MVSSMEGDITLFRKYTDLCNKLNLDAKTTNTAWETFLSVNQNYTLEGDPLNWIACAIYVACWKSVTPTVGQNVVQGNCVNFTSLLRHSNLSLAHFFCNIQKWSEMTQMPEEFINRVEHLEQTFAVAYNVFKEYGPMFMKVFKAPEPVEIEQTKHRNRKQKPVPCTSLKVFEYCWILFITIKGQDTKYSNDLVVSCNLLIAIVDWAFKNAFLSDRRDILNHQFKGLPADWANPSFIPEQAPCIISHLCSTPSIVTDVKYIKEYQFKESIKSLFDQNVLSGKDDDNFDVFDPSVFERNFKNITNTYETNILNRGEFDEKIFLAEYRRKLLEREQNQNNSEAQNAQKQTTGETATNATASGEMVVGQECLTPLTGRHYLTPRDSHGGSFVAATESTSFRLNTLIFGCQPSPSPHLVQLLSTCARNPTERIAEIVKTLGDKFVAANSNELPEITNRRLQIATTLFYKRIENILDNERAIHADISAIVERDVFYECMFACCLEIVIHSYNSRKRFPWILNVLQVQPYNFVKVIELIIRSKDKFARDTIKHLNMIEELILSSQIWKSGSIIWEAISNSEQEIPKYEETALPGQIQTELNSDQSTKNIITSDPSKILQSPGPSATDRFQSPVQQGAGVVNRELFPVGGQSVLQHLMFKDQSGVTRMIQVKVQPPTTPKKVETPAPPSPRPRRTGGLSIIFRKFYNLAWERMEHLCNNLKITSTEMQRKIWTAFEELVRKNRCELIKDRDLDQLLMCAVYMITKLTKSTEQTFAEIIKSYRTQPQATSDIYRKVLITKQAATEQSDGASAEQRGDLIKFYNTVVIEAMKKFVKNYVDKGAVNPDVLLSPLPASRGHVVQVYGNICIKPLESPSMSLGNGKVFNYYFNRSPSKDLNDINKAVKGNGVIGKRLLIGEGDLPNPKRIATRKVQSMIEERNQNTE